MNTMNTMNKRFPLGYSPDNNPLALAPPMLPGWTTPVEDYDAGIPARLVEGGLLCVVNPWGTMNAGDAFKLYWKDTINPVWSTEITKEQENQPLVFRIDAGDIVGGDAFPVFYTVQRVATQPEDSPQLNLLVKLDPPGGFDEDQGTPGHSGLRYSIPQDIIDNGVGPIEAAAGVPITINAYAFMRRNDRINVAWGSVNVYHQVTDAQVGQDITVTIPREIIEQAGDSNGVAIAYQVVDECGNYPGGYWRWSAVTHILVDLNNNRLDEPLVLVNGFPTEEIDLDDPAGNAVSVRVTGNRTEHAIGDTLRLTWRGTTADGSPVVVGPLEQTVETIPFFYDFTIPHDDVAAIAKGRASVAYVRIRSGEADRPSKSAAVSVIGDARRYLAPNIVEASGNTLDPDLNFYTLSVPYYAGRNPGDQIIIVCEGLTAANFPTYHEVPVIVAGEAVGAPVLGNLPKAQVQRLDGGSLTVYYSVNGQPASEPLNLTVGVAAPSLPIPVVVEANADDVLNPDDVNPVIGANVIVPYTATVTNDVVVLRWRGSSSSAPDDSRTLTSNTAGKAVPFTVPFAYVSANLNGTVDCSYFITRGGTSLGNSVVRQLSIGSALELPAPSVKEAVGELLDLIYVPNGATAQIPVDADLQTGDTGVMSCEGLSGSGSIDVPFIVEASDMGKKKEVIVPRSVVEANVNRSITLDYTLQRQGSGPAIPSAPAVYQVRADAQKLSLGEAYSLSIYPQCFYAWNRPPSPVPEFASYTRTATGGTGEYVYKSLSPKIATVDSATGEVSAQSNGEAVIMVTDSANNNASYVITISGIQHVVQGPSSAWLAGEHWISSALTAPQVLDFLRMYRELEGRDDVLTLLGWTNPAVYYWTGTNVENSNNAMACRNMNDPNPVLEQQFGSNFYPYIQKLNI